MDRRRSRSTAESIIKLCAMCQVTRHFLHLYLLVLLVESQAQESQDPPTTPATTRAPPKMDIPVTFEEMKMNKKAHMRYCDTEEPIYDDDDFCTRVVAIVAHPDDQAVGAGQIVAPGIFIDRQRILTSYSPFRNLRKTLARDKIYINYLIGKALFAKTMLVGYFFGRIKLSCARQIVAMEDNLIVEEQWHGTEHSHTPMHDLMILQVEKEMDFINYESWHKTIVGGKIISIRHLGPNVTEIAEADDDFPERYKIVSLGFMDDDHVLNRNHLHTSKEYETDDRMREDCEEWFPRDWGYFICIKNDDNFVSIGSGALLVGTDKAANPGEGKVFGIGSFMMQKNKASVLVFTDIRPYIEPMNMTCNKYDGH